ncbi:uncharacterized protein LOC122643625 [Telopea speciosissima]|uniref:uncharacterized protein LOC122643625 n=1 Tax=Telopea speciosissima TaxID=54955 RepID=UPI001CC3BA2C|nr:uncharacterized protein LOC122643625 [Telopea speciosissima]
MGQHHLLQTVSWLSSSLPRPVLLTSPSLQRHLIKRYTESKESDGHVIGEKGRSTAEEFSRVAKEKAESVSRTAKETLEGVKEAMVGSTDDESPKQEYKKPVEKGNYDNMGRQD